ncbi:MAG: radical SAM protein [Defluviitaleaceae bacterium]|nr:radical SAM protein [Defluviitaleaceae bacterium]
MNTKDIQTIPAKSIIYKTQSPSAWFGVDYNMNIYRGCPHGCIYCDSRSDCFQNKDFNTVTVKENALRIIRDDLKRKVKTGVVGTGAMSDPYNPVERELRLTRNSLELLNAFGFGASIVTKSSLITRDIDVLQDIQTHSPTIVKLSITTADDNLSRQLEPCASVTSERFEALHTLSESGVFCGVFIIPMLPYITDSADNLVQLLRMAKNAGAKFVYTYMGMTLRPGSREYYYEHLDKILPGTKEKYIKRYGLRKHCQSPNSKKLWGVLAEECERLGLLYDMKAITFYYKSVYANRQLTFL